MKIVETFFLVYGLIFLVAMRLAVFFSRLINVPVLSFKPPKPQKGALLVTIRYSHYVDKARFALDYARAFLLKNPSCISEKSGLSASDLCAAEEILAYRERPYTPLFHMVATLATSGGKKSSTPLLLVNSSAFPNFGASARPVAIQESHEILVFVDSLMKACKGPQLYPEEKSREILNLEREFDLKLGPAVRVLVYYQLFQSIRSGHSGALALFQQNCIKFTQNSLQPAIQALSKFFLIQMRFSHALMEVMTFAMNIRQKNAERSHEKIFEILSVVAKRLKAQEQENQKNRTPFLFPEFSHPTAADLAFCALVYPMFFPSGADALFTSYENPQVPTTIRSFVDEARKIGDGIVFRYVQGIYANYRGEIIFRCQEK